MLILTVLLEYTSYRATYRGSLEVEIVLFELLYSCLLEYYSSCFIEPLCSCLVTAVTVGVKVVVLHAGECSDYNLCW